jgi:hypothetical protein
MSFQQTEILSKVNHLLKSFQRELKFIEIVPHLSLTVSSKEFSNAENIKKLIARIQNNDCPSIYNISCLNVAHRKRLTDQYRDFQIQNTLRTKGKDRLNMSRFNKAESSTLYLGSSMNDIAGRIKQHLGGGNSRTYSLHLSKWATDFPYKISLYIYLIKHKQDKKLDRSFVELVEQSLWDHYKPIFGKKSGL